MKKYYKVKLLKLSDNTVYDSYAYSNDGVELFDYLTDIKIFTVKDLMNSYKFTGLVTNSIQRVSRRNVINAYEKMESSKRVKIIINNKILSIENLDHIKAYNINNSRICNMINSK